MLELRVLCTGFVVKFIVKFVVKFPQKCKRMHCFNTLDKIAIECNCSVTNKKHKQQKV